jgi:hypothetical protein
MTLVLQLERIVLLQVGVGVDFGKMGLDLTVGFGEGEVGGWGVFMTLPEEELECLVVQMSQSEQPPCFLELMGRSQVLFVWFSVLSKDQSFVDLLFD